MGRRIDLPDKRRPDLIVARRRAKRRAQLEDPAYYAPLSLRQRAEQLFERELDRTKEPT